MQDMVKRELNRIAKSRGFYTDADVMRVQEALADDIILENTPDGVPAPHFDSYQEKVNHIVSCGYAVA